MDPSEVTSAIPLLRTEDPTLGSVVEHKRIVELLQRVSIRSAIAYLIG